MTFDKKEKITKWVVKLILAPLVALSIYASTSYLERNYVTRDYFDKCQAEERAGLKEINGKLDTLLVRDSANAEKFADEERRISRLEDRGEKER